MTDLDDIIRVLERTPATLNTLLRGLPSSWTRITEGEGTWSPFDVVGHLIDGEEHDWMPRVRTLLEHGERQTFQPFDRFRHLEANAEARLEDLLDRFSDLRARSLEDLRGLGLTSEDMGRTGRHPEFGVVKLGQLLATWVTHDMSHLAQVSRVMAKRHDEAVGPWKAYLSVLTR